LASLESSGCNVAKFKAAVNAPQSRRFATFETLKIAGASGLRWLQHRFFLFESGLIPANIRAQFLGRKVLPRVLDLGGAATPPAN